MPAPTTSRASCTCSRWPAAFPVAQTTGLPAPRTFTALTQTYLNFVTGAAGTEAVAVAGYVPVPYRQTVLPWDINHDGKCDVSDLARIGMKWKLTAPASQEATPERPVVYGWIPEDVNDDGIVNVSDLASVGLHWGTPCHP